MRRVDRLMEEIKKRQLPKGGPNGFGVFKKRGYVIVTAGIFLITLTIHWTFAWFAYVEEQSAHNQAVIAGEYFNKTLRDTMENWQSEFLQLVWQVAGLSFLWYVASPQSKSESERVEQKLDAILKKVDPERADKILQELEEQYPKK